MTLHAVPFPGDSPNWYLERIEVTDCVTSSTTVFPCNAWLGLDEGEDTVREEGSRSCSDVLGPYQRQAVIKLVDAT